MTVAFDAGTEAAFTTESPMTFTHTPVGTPRGVTVAIVRSTESDDIVTGVTYGGVAMTRQGYAQDTGGEIAACWMYTLGASIPTGSQTVSIAVSATTRNKWAACATVTAAADTEVASANILQEDAADPSITLASTGTAMRFAAIASGRNTEAVLVPAANCTLVHSAVYDVNRTSSLIRETTPSSGSTAVGWVALIDDVAMVAVAIQEVSGAATVDPYPYIGGGYYPTEG